MATKPMWAGAYGWTAIAMAGMVACKTGPSPQERGLMAQKDSLVQEMAEQSRTLSDISAELAKVQVQGGKLEIKSESPRAARKDTILARVHYITGRLDDTEKRLQQSRRRVASMSGVSDSLKKTLQTTISNYESVVENQKTTLQQLTDQIHALATENASLTVAKQVLTDSVQQLDTQQHQAYYVIGTKDDLIKRGIIHQEGGARVLFVFGKHGQTLVPARDLDPSEFTQIDTRQVTEIALPDSAEEYRIPSRQDLDYLANPPDKDGKVSGPVLKIAEPEKFWAPSKFLIIVQG